ncbi:hypothetical protein [Anaerococcus sp. AGMB09787]|uniref:hypothetical protein n=1 Tax=Anaerococcus sp. AGMB09787 TaxID=2922869 RepID=UPI001FAEA7C7|nr:hypothetical protein [Anaerococcus sp. AGMB09787]
MIALAMGLFGISILEARRLSPHDFQLHLLAYEVKRQKEIELMSINAWFVNLAASKKKVGTGKMAKIQAVYRRYKDFYDASSEFSKIFEGTKTKKAKSMADFNRILNKRR